MEAGTYVAIYAAVVATGALGWNVRQVIRARRHDVVVTIRMGWDPAPEDRPRQVIFITALNRGQVPVGVAGVGLSGERDTSHMTEVPPAGTDLPGVLSPGAGGTSYLLRGLVETLGVDLRQPLRGWVDLDSGERVHSKPVCLVAREVERAS